MTSRSSHGRPAFADLAAPDIPALLAAGGQLTAALSVAVRRQGVSRLQDLLRPVDAPAQLDERRERQLRPGERHVADPAVEHPVALLDLSQAFAVEPHTVDQVGRTDCRSGLQPAPSRLPRVRRSARPVVPSADRAVTSRRNSEAGPSSNRPPRSANRCASTYW